MARLQWDLVGERLYETGNRNAVVYPTQAEGKFTGGVAWNGLTAFSVSPSGAEATPLYADDIKYLNLMSAEEFGFSIEAYTYPDEFAACDGSVAVAPGVYAGQQTRKPFGFCVRTTVGNDVEANDFGYKLYLIYNGMASPSEKSYATINDSPEAITFSWEVTTTPMPIDTKVDGKTLKPTACLIIDSTKVDPEKMEALEDLLYGSESAEATLPTPDEVIALVGVAG